jgi:hypothetical protein
MSEHLYLISISLIPATILLIFGMKYVSAAYQARAHAAADARYREIAQVSAQAQSASAASLSAIQAELSQIGARLSAVEKVLKDVG